MSAAEQDTVHGWCAPFCGQALDGELPRDGADPAEHGRWCRSASVAADGVGPDGRHRTVYVEANTEYLHGTYQAERVRGQLRNVIGVYLNGTDDPDVILTPGEARQLAAALVYLADVATRIDHPAPRLPRL